MTACRAAPTFEEREALAYDEATARDEDGEADGEDKPPRRLSRRRTEDNDASLRRLPHRRGPSRDARDRAFAGRFRRPVTSQLRQWSVQIKLAPVNAPWFDGAKLLIAADCTAYAYGNFHNDFIRGRVMLVGCPKLDSVDYSEKLEQILRENDIRDVTVVRMEVPCCDGLEHAAKQACSAAAGSSPGAWSPSPWTGRFWRIESTLTFS